MSFPSISTSVQTLTFSYAVTFEGDGARGRWECGGGCGEEVVPQGSEFLERGLELFFEAVGFGAQGLDAGVVGLVFGDWVGS